MQNTSNEKREADFLLHWRIASSNRRGLFCTFKRNLFPAAAKAIKESQPIQITFDYPRIVNGDLPVVIPLNLSLTPLVLGIKRVTVSVFNEDLDSLSWVGKVEHQIKFESDTEVKRLTMQAYAHEIGVYNLNNLKFEVHTEDALSTDVKLRDELLVQVLPSETL